MSNDSNKVELNSKILRRLSVKASPGFSVGYNPDGWREVMAYWGIKSDLDMLAVPEKNLMMPLMGLKYKDSWLGAGVKI